MLSQHTEGTGDETARWKKFNSFLHGLVTELTTLYQPDTFWFDCSNSPPDTDTHLEQVIDTMRTANPDVVINIRGGMWSDYTESNDQSEYLANEIFGVQQEFVGDYFEIPAVMHGVRFSAEIHAAIDCLDPMHVHLKRTCV
jgi:hypothetical protein